MPGADNIAGESASAALTVGVAELVRSLAEVMQHSGVTELDLSLGAIDVRLRRPEGQILHTTSPNPEGTDCAESDASDPGYVVTAPMVGTFYAAPTPGAPPFVTEGDEITSGQTIGIIEAMKIMNEVAADRSGVVLELLARNGQPVEYGSSLLRLGSRLERP